MKAVRAFLFLSVVSCGIHAALANPAGGPFKEKILFVTAEQTGIFNTGGLGHTTAGLGRAFKDAGDDIEMVMPYYSQLSGQIRALIADENMTYHIPWGDKADASLLKFKVYSVVNPQNGVKTFLLKSVDPVDLFENTKLPNQALRYSNRKSEEEALGMFNKAAAGFINRRRYTTIVTHDWHAGLVGHYLKQDPLAGLNPVADQRVIFMISNLGYQGATDISTFGPGAPDLKHFTPEKYEFYGKFNMMKAGIVDSDAVLTVSENYLQDIQTPRFGHGLDGFLRATGKNKPLVAITNGADVKPWIPSDFTSTDFTGKTKGKLKLQEQLSLAVGEDKPLFVFTSRLAHQKGYDYLPGALEQFLTQDSNAQMVVMGDGDARYVSAVKELENKFPKRVVYKAFSSQLELPLTQYSDFFVNVPWYEPSGTNQMFAMAAGTVPIVSDVGGLPNYVTDGKTGFIAHVQFRGDGSDISIAETQSNIATTFRRASENFRNRNQHLEIAANAMKQNNSWDARIAAYRKLFSEVRTLPSQLVTAFPTKAPSDASCLDLYQSLLPYVRKVVVHDKLE